MVLPFKLVHCAHWVDEVGCIGRNLPRSSCLLRSCFPLAHVYNVYYKKETLCSFPLQRFCVREGRFLRSMHFSRTTSPFLLRLTWGIVFGVIGILRCSRKAHLAGWIRIQMSRRDGCQTCLFTRQNGIPCVKWISLKLVASAPQRSLFQVLSP